MNLEGRSAIVSGGAGGLGAATVRRLAQLGLGVIIFDPPGQRGPALASELGSRVVAIAGDHNNDAEVATAIDAAKSLGAFSINVNAASSSIVTPRTANSDGVPHDMQTFRSVIEVHLMGPFNMSRLCAAAFASNIPDDDGQRGVIINSASTAAFDGQAGQAAYAGAKSAIVGMTRAMARDLADIGVRACAIAPGPFLTPRLASAPQSIIEVLTDNVTFPKRLGKPEEYASLVEGILRTPFLNGETIRLDGALSTPLTILSGARPRH